MNCGICKGYLREKKKCPGCRIFDKNEPVSIAKCKIRNCATFKRSKSKYCFKCEEFPCGNLKHLDKRYRTKYHMSMIENLDFIKEKGINPFLEKEKQKWKCPKCDGIITCHGGTCLNCGFEKYKN